MKKTKRIMNRILYPPKWVLFILSVVSFMALIFIFASEKTESMLAYFIYSMSAYSLIVLCAAFPKVIRKVKDMAMNNRKIQYVLSLEMVNKFLTDVAFRGAISIYQGATVNVIYTVFLIIVGVRYRSVWFVSMAVYYGILGILRAYLIVCYKQRNDKSEIGCYKNIAKSLFLLNIPMSGLIILMIRTNSGFTYSGYVIYLCALYTFYTFIVAIVNLVKFRKIGSPILSAGKVLNFVAAMVSVLGLQTAMISNFSVNGEDYRKMMNTITGGLVYGMVIIIAIYMLMQSRKIRKRDEML